MLMAARLLVRFVPLSRWRHLLGNPVKDAGNAHRNEPSAEEAETVRRCVAAVRRASFRLPSTLCLPQAIGLFWMLRRRKVDTTIAIGFLPAGARGTPDDLHAWVEWNGSKILGDSGEKHAKLLQFRR